MTLNELILAQQIEAARRRNLEWSEVARGLQVESAVERPGGIRHAIAASLVRGGLLLDRRAAEIAAARQTAASQREVGHAL